MPVANEHQTLRLSGALDASQVPALYRELVQRREPVTRIDLSGIDRADSAGVALLQVLRQRFRDANGKLPEVIGASSEFLHLCQAHRVEFVGQ